MLVIVFGVCPASAAAREATAEDIKVAYLYKFFSYIKWTKSADDFTLCVYRGTHLRDELFKLENAPVGEHRIKIAQIDYPEQDISSCMVLVLPELEPTQLQTLTASASQSNTLTISDREGYAAKKVMINFVILNNKIKFEINLDEVKRAKLIMGSSLLKLAKIVKTEEGL